METTDTCPTCGTYCRVTVGHGTAKYEPVWNPIRDDRDRFRAALRKIGYPDSFIQSRSVLSGIAREALEKEETP